MPMQIGQSVVTLAIAKGQTFVIEAQLVQDGRVQVADMHFILDRVPTEVVGHSMKQAHFDATPRQHIVKPKV